MLIGEMLTKIMKKETTIEEIATMYSVTNQTIQRKIKKLGYEWDKKKAIYTYTGKPPQPLNVDFSTLFRKIPAVSKDVMQPKSKNKKKESIRNSTSDVVDVLLVVRNHHLKECIRGFILIKTY
ncbi:hypothetical protein Q8G32_28955 [Priestia megaterium]|uniref:hypothetical protein n=1 Tax=Priestia megaterium TaxID=1404 RepID=UPI002731760F|nr:hypothetical protein [Priestia megaterium]MDP1471872.1 hypothetical protein [Priestia megaterium]